MKRVAMNTTMSRRRKKLLAILIGTGTLIPLLSVSAATAAFMPGGLGDNWQDWVLDHWSNPLEQIRERLAGIDPIMETIMQGALGNSWEKLEHATGASPPNPYEVRTVEEDVSPGILTTNPIVR